MVMLSFTVLYLTHAGGRVQLGIGPGLSGSTTGKVDLFPESVCFFETTFLSHSRRFNV